jgi:hypothetical protein
MGATGVYDDPDFTACGQSKGENSVWYEFTPSRNGRITVSTMGSSYDTVLGIWAGTRGSLSSLGCNDDYLGTSSQVTADLRASTKYYIEVDQYMGPLPRWF